MLRAILACAAAVILWTPQASAAQIFFLPASATVVPGNPVSIDLMISSLGSGVVLGDFDLDISFDPTHLSLTGFQPSDALGSIAAGDALDFSLGLVSSGLVNVTVISTLSSAALSTLQSEPFRLAALEFNVLALTPGASTQVEVASLNALGDGDGNSLSATSLGSAILRGQGDQIPEPGTLLLVPLGLLILSSKRRRPYTRHSANSHHRTVARSSILSPRSSAPRSRRHAVARYGR